MLSIEQLSHTYANGVCALDHVSLELNPGMFGLLGPNGAGKSTLMQIVATLQQPTGGQVRFDGIDVLARPMAMRRVLGYLPQDFGVYPKVSAWRLLDHLALLKGITDRSQRRHTVARLLELTNLSAVRDRAVASYSGGMLRRFGIAQALLGQPRLIIVDEPTAGLDPEERIRFHNLLAEIGEERVVILSTHIVEDVANLCPDMAILCAGRIQLRGTPEALRRRLDGQIWTRPSQRAEREALEREHRVLSHQVAGGQLHTRVKAADRPGALFEPTKPTLEDVYFDAVHSGPGGVESGDRAAA